MTKDHEIGVDVACMRSARFTHPRPPLIPWPRSWACTLANASCSSSESLERSTGVAIWPMLPAPPLPVEWLGWLARARRERRKQRARWRRSRRRRHAGGHDGLGVGSTPACSRKRGVRTQNQQLGHSRDVRVIGVELRGNAGFVLPLSGFLVTSARARMVSVVCTAGCRDWRGWRG